MAVRTTTVNPANFPDEVFDLYSIPAFDSKEPELVLGGTIGSPKQVVQPGDILLSKIVPHIRRCWIVSQSRGKRMIASGEWIVFRTSSVDSNYLRQLLLGDQFHAQYMNTVAGVGGSLLRARPNFVAQIKVPIPALSKQQRIAQVLDSVDALRAKRREAILLLDDLVQSTFLDMFGNFANLTQSWPTRSLSTVAKQINDCPHSTPKWTDNGLICLRTSNLLHGEWNWADTRYVSEQTFNERSKRGPIEPGDIILSREGTVGIAAIVEQGMRLCMGQRLVQVRANTEIVSANFLLQYLLQILRPERISHYMLGSTSQHLNVRDLKNLMIPLPPVELQEEFDARLTKIISLKQIHRTHLAELDALFASLQDRAFRGEIWDTPAS